MVLPDSDLLSRVRSYSGAGQTPSPFAYGTLTPSGAPFQVLRLGYLIFVSGPTTPLGDPSGLGYSAFARRYLRSRGFFPFLQLLRCFSSLGWPPPPMHSVAAGSGTPGSSLV